MASSLRSFQSRTSAVLIIDHLEMRRACTASWIRPWADRQNMSVIELAPSEALEQTDAVGFKLILLLAGAIGVKAPHAEDLIASLRDKFRDAPIVIMSESEKSEEVVAAFQSGVRGFIPMSIAPMVAVEAFEFIMTGGTFFPPAVLVDREQTDSRNREQSYSRISVHKDAAARELGLTVRQQQVLERLRCGDTNKLIARQLNLSASTVKVHVRHIMRKIGAANRTQVALFLTLKETTR